MRRLSVIQFQRKMGDAFIMRVLTFCVVSLGAVLVAGAAAGAPPLSRSDGQGNTPDNPITEVGGSAAFPTAVVIKFPDGTGEVVYTDRPATIETGGAVLAERVAAENRPASHAQLASRRSTSGVSRHNSSESWGSSLCSVGRSISKTAPTTVKGFVTSSCTADITFQSVAMYLYRSANLTLIGQGTKTSNNPFLNASTGGTCLSSTWQYNLQTAFNAISSVNGSITRQLWDGPIWISC